MNPIEYLKTVSITAMCRFAVDAALFLVALFVAHLWTRDAMLLRDKYAHYFWSGLLGTGTFAGAAAVLGLYSERPRSLLLCSLILLVCLVAATLVLAVLWQINRS